MKYCLSIDWFQVFCKAEAAIDFHLDTYIKGCDYCPAGYIPNYHVQGGRERHSIFRQSVTLYLHKFPLLHIFYQPKMSAIDPLAVAVKVANRALYSGTWAWYLEDVMKALGLHFVSISRLDLCCDFQHFTNMLDPRVFIQRYLAEGPLSDGIQYIRKGSNMYHVTGRKRKTFISESGEVDADRSQNRPEYIRFGSHKSGVSVYLYNKTLELYEKHHKPYIREMWVKNGIIEDETKPVWRLEISVKSKGMSVEDKSSSQVVKSLGLRNIRQLGLSDFVDQATIANVFWAYANKYWVFRQVTKVKYVKDMPIVPLFDVQLEPTIMPRDMSLSLDTGRAEMLAGRTLQRIADECPSIDTDAKHALWAASNVLVQIGVMKKDIFDKDVPPDLQFYNPYSDVWQQLLANYKVRPSQLHRLRYRCEHLLAERMRDLLDEPLFKLLADKCNFV